MPLGNAYNFDSLGIGWHAIFELAPTNECDMHCKFPSG